MTKGHYYVLPMFPYPSGTLHLGHIRVYALSDAHARYQRLLRPNQTVLHPIGWDAFGLPAETAARARKSLPVDWTAKNISQMRRTLRRMNFSFDWSGQKEISTAHPGYYRWTQWLFLRLYEAGLVYQERGLVNWDPKDQTVLAKGEVDSLGRGIRSGMFVERKWTTQWFIRISKFAESLHADLDHLDWPKKVKDLQRNWIGRMKGIQTTNVSAFSSPSLDGAPEGFCTVFIDSSCFSPKALRANDFRLLIGPLHPLLRKDTSEKLTMDVKFYQVMPLPFWISNPLTGNSKRIPVCLSMDVKCDEAIMEPILKKEKIFLDDESVSDENLKEWASRLRGAVKTIYKLKDWLISRQRAWGTPIPIIHCPSCGITAVPEGDLPVLLRDWSPTPHIQSAKCPKCGSLEAYRDPDTMDTFVDSSWYWARYPSSRDSQNLISPLRAKTCLPVDLYIGGNEHAILHLLYARFIGKFLTQERILELPYGEPFSRLLTQGMVLGQTWVDPKTGRYYRQDEVSPDSGTLKDSPEVKVSMRWEKMSKSKGNGVDAERLIEKYGSDIVRLFVLSRVGASEDLAWDESGIHGMERWIQRLDSLLESYCHSRSESGKANSNCEIGKLTRDTLVKVNLALEETQGLHNAISALMILSRDLQERADICICRDWKKSFESLVIMVTPFAPQWANKATDRIRIESPKWPRLDTFPQETETLRFQLFINNKIEGHIDLDPAYTRLKDSAWLISLLQKSEWGQSYVSRHAIFPAIQKVVVNHKDKRLRVILPQPKSKS